MNPEQSWLFFLLQKIGGTDVCGEHALFDEAVRIVTDNRNDGFDFSLLVESHLRFDSIEIDGAAFLAGGMQRFEQRIQGMQLWLYRLMHRRCRRDFARQPTPDLVIGQPCARLENGRIETVLGHFAVGIDLCIADHGQSIDIGIQ